MPLISAQLGGNLIKHTVGDCLNLLTPRTMCMQSANTCACMHAVCKYMSLHAVCKYIHVHSCSVQIHVYLCSM